MVLSKHIGQLVLTTSFGGPAPKGEPAQKPIPAIYGDAAYPETAEPEGAAPATTETLAHISVELGECAEISKLNAMLNHEDSFVRSNAIHSCHPAQFSISIGVQTLTRGVSLSYNPHTLKCECN